MSNLERNKYLLKNAGIFLIGNIGTKLINFLLVPLYTYALNTYEYGVVDLVGTLGFLLGPILMLNIHEGVLRFCIDKDADTDAIMSIGYIALGSAMLLGLLVLPICNRIDVLQNYSIYIYTYIVTYGFKLMSDCYLRGTERLALYSTSNIIYTLAIATLSIVFLTQYHLGIKGYLLAYILSNGISALFNFITGKMYLVKFNIHVDHQIVSPILKYSLVLIPNTFMWWIVNSSDRIMISYMLGSAINGIYAVSYKIPSMLQTLSQMFIQAWSYSAINEAKSSDKDKYNSDIYNFLVVIVTLLGGIAIIIIKPFMHIYVNEAYQEAWLYSPILIVGFAFLALASFLGTQYTVYKDSKGFVVSSSIAAILNIVLNFIFIPVIGVLGAAIATALGYIAVFVYRSIDTKKYINIDVFSFENIRLYSCLFIICATSYIEKYSHMLFGIEGMILLWICKKELIGFMVGAKQLFLNKLRR